MPAIFLFVWIGAPLWLQPLIATCSVAINKRSRERKGKRAATSCSAFYLNTSSLLFAKLFAHVETETGSLLNLVVIWQIWFWIGFEKAPYVPWANANAKAHQFRLIPIIGTQNLNIPPHVGHCAFVGIPVGIKTLIHNQSLFCHSTPTACAWPGASAYHFASAWYPLPIQGVPRGYKCWLFCCMIRRI